MTTQFVFFDLDDTLLDHKSAQEAALRDLAVNLLGFVDSSDEVRALQRVYHDRNRELWHRYATGDITRDDLRRARFEHVLSSFGTEVDWRDLDVYYMTRYSDHWSEVDGARRAFQAVARRFPVGVITNGFVETQRSKLDRFPFIREQCKAVLISEEVGYLKPDPRLFAQAEKEAGFRGKEILYVGDSLRSDILGAVQAGWHAAWYTAASDETDLPDTAFAFCEWDELLRRLGVAAA